MPRGDATRGAGLSTYYEPRLLSSRFFFSPQGSPSTPPPRALSSPLLLLLLLLLPPLYPFPAPVLPCPTRNPIDSSFTPRPITYRISLSFSSSLCSFSCLLLYSLVFELVFIPKHLECVYSHIKIYTYT